MTYNYRNYEWTAFTEADLLDQGGNGSSFGYGDTFSMPASATVCLSTKDNDYFLSGDYYSNERADDRYGQNAYVDGEPAGGKMYAESYHVLKGSDGNTYYLIEIEIEGHDAPGQGEDYFTFYNDVPPAGVELTVVKTCGVKGNWVDYKCLGAGDKIETGSISGTVFCDLDCDGINGEVTTIPGCDYKIEAENMHKSGFKTVDGNQASGGELVKLAYPGCYGTLCTTFDGKTGVYDVKIRVQDENDGQSKIKLKVDGQLVEAIRLDADSDGGGSNDGGFSTYVIKDVAISNGEDITIKTKGDGYEYVRIDNIVLEGQDQQEVVPEPGKADVTIKLLDAGGVVVATTTTDADGNYRFDGIEAGDYKIMGVAPDGTEFTIQDAGSDDAVDSDVDENGMSGVITVGANTETDIDLGVVDPQPGSLSGRYFEDTDGSDTDNGEPGVANAEVTLTNLDTGEVSTTTTDADGFYAFTDLEPGTYEVLFAEVDGFGFVAQDQGGDDTIDSDVTAAGKVEIIEIGKGEAASDVDAGIRPCGNIFGESGVDDVLIGCDTDDNFRGFSGNDLVDARGGDDFIDLGRGNDTAIGGAGNDTIDGSFDFDTAIFGGAAADYTITLNALDGSSLTVTGPDGEDLLIDVELLQFDDQDVLISSLILSASDDTADLPALNGSVSVDVLANDNPGQAPGTPVVMSVTDGQFGTASVEPDGQITYTATAEATGGFDVVSYTVVDSQGRMATAELLLGDIAAPDASAPGAVILGDGGETFEGSGLDDIIIGGSGGDTIAGRGGNDGINGAGGNDSIQGSAGDDTIIGGEGDDDLSGNRGNDLISGGGGNDTIAGSGDNDQILGGDGDDDISANPGDDFIFAGAGNDTIDGNVGNELIFAGQGDDEINRIGEGADRAFGGDGDDVFVWRDFQADGVRDLIDGQSGIDTLEVQVAAADFAAMQVEVDAYLMSLAANADDTNGVVSSYSFSTIALDIANIENIDLTFA
ncbi:SdrD B-like domain-containing protein [Leisingera sp. NJS204]|uniref:SdrD B-like domain-containing protein n=1 Tax=Leisingera sp. NJS204 TaxID=2508307 RepID=UPI001012F931|nr:SdrD B-like domain-containing protein [Leisingera sp. NJS204]QAX29918.1 hypothetical protein ETW24_11360 [Leisingera sp. NJS204]QAX32142.1 hypothetical protein ETW24_22410 [Leisingera sp. NJS204]